MAKLSEIQWKLDDEKRLMTFRCPEYLIERLMSKGFFQDVTCIVEMFEEWKKFVNLSMAHPEIKFPMMSADIDEIWHNFILFTREYHEFCNDILNINYFHHAPAVTGEKLASVSAEKFSQMYSDKFGETVSAYWGDLFSCKVCDFDCSGADCINDSCQVK